MPAKTPAHLIESAVQLYADGFSSAQIQAKIGLSDTAVCRYAREAGIIRSTSESKKILYARRPRPIAPRNRDVIHRSSTSPKKTCPACKQELLATVDYFYRRNRENGRYYLSSRCKSCIRKERSEHRQKNHEKTLLCMRNSWKSHGHKYNQQKRLRRLFDPDFAKKSNAACKEWLTKNAEYALIYRAAYRLENAQAIASRNKNWYQRNRDKARASRICRKARKKGASGRFSVIDVSNQLILQDRKCMWCQAIINGNHYHVDHVIPIVKGGTNGPENIVITCPTCNMSKGKKSPEDFLAYLDFIKSKADEIEEKRKYMRDAMRKHRAKKKSLTDY